LDYLVRAENGREAADQRHAEPADSELVLLAQAGDQLALEALCRRNWRPVYRSFARYTNDPFEAEDLTQEVFVRALRSLPRFTAAGAPYRAYLLRIAGNLARDRWRAGTARAVPTGQLPDQSVPGPGPDGVALANERRAALVSALDRLAPDQRAVVRLRFLEGRSPAEVGELTNRSPAAVRQLQVRALAALREALGDQPDGLIENFGRH
jgi:RNA polymerase sigma-70 factor (ECF subfamily)